MSPVECLEYAWQRVGADVEPSLLMLLFAHSFWFWWKKNLDPPSWQNSGCFIFLFSQPRFTQPGRREKFKPNHIDLIVKTEFYLICHGSSFILKWDSVYPGNFDFLHLEGSQRSSFPLKMFLNTAASLAGGTGWWWNNHDDNTETLKSKLQFLIK